MWDKRNGVPVVLYSKAWRKLRLAVSFMLISSVLVAVSILVGRRVVSGATARPGCVLLGTGPLQASDSILPMVVAGGGQGNGETLTLGRLANSSFWRPREH